MTKWQQIIPEVDGAIYDGTNGSEVVTLLSSFAGDPSLPLGRILEEPEYMYMLDYDWMPVSAPGLPAGTLVVRPTSWDTEWREVRPGQVVYVLNGMTNVEAEDSFRLRWAPKA